MKDKMKCQCLALMAKMMSRPLCSQFIEGGSSLFPRARKRKRTLESIRTSLAKGEYSGLQEWSTAVLEFWQSMRKLSTNELTRAVVDDMEEWFTKRKAKLAKSTGNKSEWISRFTSGYLSLVDVFLKTNDYDSLAEFSQRLKTPPDEPLYFPLEKAEIKKLAKAISMITDDEIMKETLAIIKTIEATSNERVSIGRTGDVVVHLESCSPQTHHALRSYVLSKFQACGMKYPD